MFLLLFLTKRAYLTLSSIINKTLYLFKWFDCKITLESVSGTNQSSMIKMFEVCADNDDDIDDDYVVHSDAGASGS